MRAMKDSGIEWIGEIPESWDIQRGKNIMEKLERPVLDSDGVITCFRDGEVTLRSNRREEGFTISTQETGYQGIEPGDLVVHGMDGFAGAIGISDSRGKATPVLNVLDSTENKKYLAYFMRTAAYCGLFLSLATGIRIRTCDTNWNKLKTILYLVPPLPEQRAISAYLDRQCALIDSVTEKTKASIEEYKKLRQAVITQAVTKGVRGDRPMKDSGIEWIGEIPENWTMLKMKRCLLSAESGLSAVTNDDSSDTGKYILRTSAVSSGIFKEDEVKPVTQYALERLICPVESDTVIMSRMNTAKMVGKCAYIEKDYPDYYIPDKLWKLKFNNRLYAKFAWYLIDSEPIQGWFSCLATGSSDSMQNIALPDFYNTIAPIPPKEEQEEITAYLDAKCAEIDALITKKETFLTELEAYKKSLIYEYVTGKKEVPQP